MELTKKERKRRKSDPNLEQVIRSYEEKKPLPDHSYLLNPYVPVIDVLRRSGYGLKLHQIKKKVRDHVPYQVKGLLNKLIETGIVKYDEKRYFLTDMGEELLKYLPRRKTSF